MRKRNPMKILVLSTLCLFLCGCSVLSSSKYVVDDTVYSEKILEKIVYALENNEPEKIKELFSENALKEVENIEEDIQYLMDYYKGEMQSYCGLGSDGSSSVEGGERLRTLFCGFEITTDVDVYNICFYSCLVDTEEPDNEGIYTLEMIRDDEKENESYNEFGGPGIFNPTKMK